MVLRGIASYFKKALAFDMLFQKIKPNRTIFVSILCVVIGILILRSPDHLTSNSCENSIIEKENFAENTLLQNPDESALYTTGLYVRYAFDNTANLGQDTSGNGHTATYSGTTSISYLNGSAALFDTAGEEMTFSNTSAPSGTFTVCAWVKLNTTHEIETESTTGTGGTSGQNYLCGGHGGESATLCISLGTNGVTAFNMGNSLMAPLSVYDSELGTEWIHVAVVVTNNIPSIFVNGQWMHTGLASNRTPLMAPTMVGNAYYGIMNGYVDDFRIYSSALTAANLVTVMTDTRPNYPGFMDDVLAFGGSSTVSRATDPDGLNTAWDFGNGWTGKYNTDDGDVDEQIDYRPTTRALYLQMNGDSSDGHDINEYGYIQTYLKSGCYFATSGADITFTFTADWAVDNNDNDVVNAYYMYLGPASGADTYANYDYLISVNSANTIADTSGAITFTKTLSYATYSSWLISNNYTCNSIVFRIGCTTCQVWGTSGTIIPAVIKTGDNYDIGNYVYWGTGTADAGRLGIYKGSKEGDGACTFSNIHLWTTVTTTQVANYSYTNATTTSYLYGTQRNFAFQFNDTCISNNLAYVNYTLTRGGTSAATFTGTWSSGSTFTVMDAIGAFVLAGTYTFSLTIRDGLGGTSTFTLPSVTVINNAPTRTTNSSTTVVNFKQATTLSWTFADTSVNPGLVNRTYTIVNGSTSVAGTWTPGVPITRDHTIGNRAGSYSYNITVNDGGGRSATHIITITVNAIAPNTPDFLNAVAGNEQNVLSWDLLDTPAVEDGGLDIVGYLIERQINNSGTWVTAYYSSGPSNYNWVDTDVVVSSTYQYRIATNNSEGLMSSFVSSSSVTPFSVPDAPTNFMGEEGTASDVIRLTWDRISDEQLYSNAFFAYTIQYSSDDITYQNLVGITDREILTYSCSGLTNGASYWFRIKTVSTDGSNYYSSNYTVIGSYRPYYFPDAVSNVICEGASGTVFLSWTVPNGNGRNIVGYEVFTGTTNSPSSLIWIANCSSPSYVDTGLTNGICYYYVIRAVNEIYTRGSNSSIVSCLPLTNPDAPTSVVVIEGNSQLTVSWTAPVFTGGIGVSIAYYRVYRSVDGINYYQIDSSPVMSTSVQDNTVVNEITYYYRIAACTNVDKERSSVNSTASNPAHAHIAPSAPTNIEIISGNMNNTLSWSAAADNGVPISKYMIYYGITPDSLIWFMNVSSSIFSYVHTGLTNGQTYYYLLCAVNTNEDRGTNSSIYNGTPTVILTPETPAGFSGSVGFASQTVTLTWTATTIADLHSLMFYQYLIQISLDGGITYGSDVIISTQSQTNFEWINLINGNSYYFRIKVMSTDGSDYYSSPYSVTGPVYPYWYPLAPTELEISYTFNSMTLNWGAAGSNGRSITGYQIYRSIDGSPYINFVTIGNLSSYIDSDLLLGQTYSYLVAGINIKGTGPNSTLVSAMAIRIPFAPYLTATEGNNSITLNWILNGTYSGASITQVSIYRQSFVANIWSGWENIANTTDTTFLDTTVVNGIHTRYYIAACNLIGEGDTSNEVEVIPHTAPDAVSNITATGSDGQIHLNWVTPANNGRPIVMYLIYHGEINNSASLVWISNVSATFFTHTLGSAKNGVPQYYLLCAVNDLYEYSANSTICSGIPIANSSYTGGIDLSPQIVILQPTNGSQYSRLTNLTLTYFVANIPNIQTMAYYLNSTDQWVIITSNTTFNVGSTGYHSILVRVTNSTGTSFTSTPVLFQVLNTNNTNGQIKIVMQVISGSFEPGQTVEIQITITNTGLVPLQNVNFYLYPQTEEYQIDSQSLNTYLFQTLAVDQSKIFTIRIVPTQTLTQMIIRGNITADEFQQEFEYPLASDGSTSMPLVYTFAIAGGAAVVGMGSFYGLKKKKAKGSKVIPSSMPKGHSDKNEPSLDGSNDLEFTF